MKEHQFVDPEKLQQAQDALVAHILSIDPEQYDHHKAESGAVLLLMCVGITCEQIPVDERPTMNKGVAEAFLRAGVDEEQAERMADAIACRDIARKNGAYVPKRYRPISFVDAVLDEYSED